MASGERLWTSAAIPMPYIGSETRRNQGIVDE